jgi:imidazolonepropionase-like amidohydrolase
MTENIKCLDHVPKHSNTSMCPSESSPTNRIAPPMSNVRRLLSGLARVLRVGPVLIASLCVAQDHKPLHEARWTIIHAGTLLSDSRSAPRHEMSILVKDDKIADVREGYVGISAISDSGPKRVRVVELQQQFVMAGMVDAHTHINFPDPDFNIGLSNVEEIVRGGATTARDAGSVPEVIFPLRQAIADGLVIGPRILASGALITTTGGHGDFRNGKLGAELSPPRLSSGVCDGVEECVKVTRRQVQFGADQIKIIVSGGLMDDSDTGLGSEFTDEELRAIVKTAHLMQRSVMAHVYTAESIKAAVDAGVNSIEHGTFLDEDGARRMAEHHVLYDPTLHVQDLVLQAASHPDPTFPESDNTARKVRTMIAAARSPAARIGLAQRFGLTILAGSDGSGPITNEVIALVDEGRMSPRDALTAATVNGAAAVGLSNSIGTIAPGKSADVIAFDGNPLANIHDCQRLHFVMARGHTAVDLDSTDGADATPATVYTQ